MLFRSRDLQFVKFGINNLISIFKQNQINDQLIKLLKCSPPFNRQDFVNHEQQVNIFLFFKNTMSNNIEFF